MILPDINLLVYAYNADAPRHDKAKAWWEAILNAPQPVAIPWVVSHGFIRLMTHPRVTLRPLTPGEAITHVRAWLDRPLVHIIEPGNRHLDIFESLLDEVGVGGNLTTDAFLAALAIEHQCVLHSNDTDFARFSGLRWQNPLS
ncbi:MAG: type II toxin-antitoxin system VapC family toxin [Acidobacteriota bacterium]